jgi:SAM-dependent methyltransferase
MTPDSEYVKCDYCGSDNSERLFGKNHGTKLHQDQFPYVKCRDCGLIYLNPRPKSSTIKKYYPDNYLPFRPAIEDEPCPIMRWIRQLKLSQRRILIERYCYTKPGKILDVGCATGLFLNEMNKHLWETEGVEISDFAINYARNKFGLSVFQGFLEGSHFDNGTFDVITFWDVLEHTYSPQATLRKASELLKSNGLLVINIPNWNSAERKIFGQNWAGFDAPKHLYVFTQNLIEGYLTKFEFSLSEWICFYPTYFSFILSLENYLNANQIPARREIIRTLQIPGIRFVFEPYFSILNRRKQGGVITVVARKIIRP